MLLPFVLHRKHHCYGPGASHWSGEERVGRSACRRRGTAVLIYSSYLCWLFICCVCWIFLGPVCHVHPQGCLGYKGQANCSAINVRGEACGMHLWVCSVYRVMGINWKHLTASACNNNYGTKLPSVHVMPCIHRTEWQSVCLHSGDYSWALDLRCLLILACMYNS